LYCFDEYIFNKESNKLWNKFGRKKHGLKLVYIYLSVVFKDKTDNCYGKWFRTSTREINYRSGLNLKGVKEHINTLITIGLVERRLKRKKINNEKEEYKTESYYKLRSLTQENLSDAIYKFDYIDMSKYVKQIEKKVRLRS